MAVWPICILGCLKRERVMQTNLTFINDFRKLQRRRFLDRFGRRLDQHISEFIRSHMGDDFMQLTRGYVHDAASHELPSWDYQDFRDLLEKALFESMGLDLIHSLSKTSWFDERIITNEEVMERCTSAYILESSSLNKKTRPK